MVGIPALPTDEVLYAPRRIYALENMRVDIESDSALDIYGNVYINGVPIGPTPYYDVKAYGAKGDGVTDDTSSIQAAVTACSSAGGGCVSFPGGTFIVGNILCPISVSLRGAGQASTILKCKTGTTGNWFQMGGYSEVSSLWFNANLQNVIALYMYQAARSMLHQLYFTDGGPTATAIRAQGTAPASASHTIRFTDINIIGYGGYGIVLHDYAYDTELVNVWIGTCGVGMWCYTGAQQLTGVHIWGCAGDALFLSDGALSRIANCYFESNGGSGIHALTGARGWWVGNTEIWNNAGKGIWVESGQKARIVGCTIFDNVGPGIQLDNHVSALISACHFYNWTGTPQTYAVLETGTTDQSIIIGNQALDTGFPTGIAFSLVGIRSTVFGNKTTIQQRETTLIPSMIGQGSGVTIDSPAGFAATLAFRTDNTYRWFIQKNVGAETGSNAGSDLIIGARTDAGGFLSNPLVITRSTGQVTLGGSLSIADAKDIIIGTATGSKIGTSSTAKLGFYGATPIVRGTVTAAGTDAATTQTLANSLRTALIALGLVT